MDEDSNFGGNALVTGGQIVTGADMMADIRARKFDVAEEPTEEPAKPEQKDTRAEELAELRSQFGDLQRSNQELRSNLDRQTGAFQSLAQQTQQQFRQPQEVLPSFETEDPELAAAFNTLDQRVDKKLQHMGRQQQELQLTYIRNQEAARVRSAIEDMKRNEPEFGNLFTDNQLMQFAQPYVNDPRYAGMDWKNEFNLAFQAADAPRIRAENAALKQQLSDHNKKIDRDRQKQKSDLKQVPSIGQRSGGAPNGELVGESILREARSKGKKLSMKQFGQELRKRSSWG